MQRLLAVILALMLMSGCAARPRTTQEAIAKVAKARPDPLLARRENAKAVQLIRQQKYAEAEEALKKALTADLTLGRAHNNLGTVYFRQSKFYLAAWQFQYAIKLMPDHFEPRNNLGLLYEELGKLNQAVDCYTEALSFEPSNPLLLGNLARARVRRGDRGQDLRDLLDLLIAQDSRPEWLMWAKSQLFLMQDPPKQ